MTVYKEGTLGTRTILLPSTEAVIALQRDHNSPSHFYLVLEHVNFVVPDSDQQVAPTYEAYVQCSNGVSMATHQQPATFCIKHSRLILKLTKDGFPYKPATLYFTNIPREFHVFPTPTYTAPRGQLLFNVRVGVWYAKVISYSYSGSVSGGHISVYVDPNTTLIRLHDVECQAYSVSGESSFVVDYTGE